MKAVLSFGLAIVLLVLAACSSSGNKESPQVQPTARPPNTRSTAQPLVGATALPTSDVLAVFPTKTPRPAAIQPTDAPEEITAVSTIDLKVRKGPGTGFPQTGVLKKGTIVRLLGKSSDDAWLQHETGWSSAAYLTTEADLSQLPTILVEAPPPTIAPALAPKPTALPPPTAIIQAPPPSNCDPSYPTVCIPPPPPDLDCGDIPYRRFKVLPPDPHRFDGDHDGIGCES